MKENEKGVVALITLLIIGAVCLSVVTAVSLAGIGQIDGALSWYLGEKAARLAESCAEEVLIKGRDNKSVPLGGINLGWGNCSYVVSENLGLNTAQITATVGSGVSYTKRLEITFSRGERSVGLIAWREVE
jgi:hypothetical protein